MTADHIRGISSISFFIPSLISFLALRDCWNKYVSLQSSKTSLINKLKKLEVLKKNPNLESEILSTWDSSELADIAQPFKSSKVTKASKAREKGLGTLAEKLLLSSSYSISDYEKEKKDLNMDEKEIEEGIHHV